MVIKITLNNSFCYVSKAFNALPRPVQNKIVKTLSYEKRVDYYHRDEIYLFLRNGKEEDFDRYYVFPTGLLFKFHSLVKGLGVRIDYNDLRGPRATHRPVEEFFNRLSKIDPDITKRDYQINALNKCLKYGRGLVEHATASGKTVIIAGLTYCINVKTLIICIRKDHLFQMKEDIERMVGGRVTAYGSGYNDMSGQIVVSNVQALHALSKRDLKGFKDKLNKFRCVIGDEAHLAAESYRSILYHSVNARYKYGFSGTMHREDGSFLEVEGAIGPILDKVDYAFLEQGGYISKANFYFVDPMVPILSRREDYWPNCLRYGIIENRTRNNKIAVIANHYVSKGKQVLIITPFRVAHGRILEDLIPGSKFLHGGSENYERQTTVKEFKSREFNVLISSSIFDEFINLPDVGCVILAGGGKAHNKFFQRVGRGIRRSKDKTSVDIITFWDSHSGILLKHSKRLKKYMKKIETWINHIRMIGQYRNN